MKKTIILIFIVFSLLSCTKTIVIDVSNTPSKYVIEGLINNKGENFISISKSINFYDSNIYPFVSNAIITVEDPNNTVFVFNETQIKGMYYNNQLIAKPLQTYKLSVKIGTEIFFAYSTMPAAVSLDSIIYNSVPFRGEQSIIVSPYYKDPVAIGNNYQFILKKNNYTFPNIFVWDDNINNGGISTRPLISQNRSSNDDDSTQIIKGDLITIEMRNIDRNVYKYLYTLQQNNSNQIAPADPSSNFGGNVLGYFSAFCVDRKTILIK
ncbi:MAG: DUF4249 family protein [Sediminibacterium sp.]|nr:DUF4249 family protein [Sediminibacterium sp.]